MTRLELCLTVCLLAGCKRAEAEKSSDEVRSEPPASSAAGTAENVEPAQGTAVSAGFGSSATPAGASASASPAAPASVATAAPKALTAKGAPTAKPSKKPRRIPHVFVIALENHDATQLYGNNLDAPYFNSLLPKYARADDFQDSMALDVPSAPHYVWMEAGTNRFPDASFTDNAPPSAENSTGSVDHLVTQIEAAKPDLSWMSYQEGIDASTGLCPVAYSGYYVPKHNPFVYFRDVSGDPPSKDNAYCIAHHKPLSALFEDLKADRVASYAFITPDECHDMHGQRGCPPQDPLRLGDDWLKSALPPLIGYANAHNSVIFLVFDEGDQTAKLPFVAIGPMIKPNYVGTLRYTHSSLLKSIELILGLEPLATVAGASDLSDLFRPGHFP